MKITNVWVSSGIGALIGIFLALIGIWLDGFDFNERGGRAVICYFLSLLCGFVGGFVGAVIFNENKMERL